MIYVVLEIRPQYINVRTWRALLDGSVSSFYFRSLPAYLHHKPLMAWGFTEVILDIEQGYVPQRCTHIRAFLYSEGEKVRTRVKPVQPGIRTGNG